MPNDFNEPITLFITWTTYGSWLPGDSRGWMKWKKGEQQPQPVLEDWCKGRMKEKAVLLDAEQRDAVENVVREHSQHRGWELHAVSARSNHVHVAVTVVPKTGNQEYRIADGVKRVRDQFKANATRVLRQGDNPTENEKVWTKGGDIQFIDTDDDLEQVVIYISETQDRMDRGKKGLTNRRLAPCRSQVLFAEIIKLRPDWAGTKIKNDEGKEVGYNHEDGAIRIIMTGNATDAADIQQHVFTQRTRNASKSDSKTPTIH